MPTQKNINPATIVTISRFFLVPVFIYFFFIDNFQYAVITLIVASLTDVLDGTLARKFNMGTPLGSVLDPLADKFLMLVSFLAMSSKGIIPWYVTALIIGRDLYIVLGCLYIYCVRRINLIIKPTILSKRTTFSQFILLVLSFIEAFLVKKAIDVGPYGTILVFRGQDVVMYVTVFLTIITFFQYTKIGIDMNQYGTKRKDLP